MQIQESNIELFNFVVLGDIKNTIKTISSPQGGLSKLIVIIGVGDQCKKSIALIPLGNMCNFNGYLKSSSCGFFASETHRLIFLLALVSFDQVDRLNTLIF